MLRILLPILFLVSLSSYANANLITNGTFESGSISNGINFSTVTGPYGTWLDRANWTIQSGGPTGNYAQQDTCTNCTDQLFQAFLGTYAPSGWLLQLDFDYSFVKPSGTQGTELVQIVGLDSGDQWNYAAGPTGWCFYCDTLYSASLSTTSSWEHFTSPWITVPQNYAAIGVLFQFGGTIEIGTFRAVDNVSLSAVPEPSTLLLLGSGLVGGAAFAHRFRKRG